tara:strand:+ start:29465 stop:30382 length:918 start_codon:yes stop_codon:yes gene_type:complete
MLRRHTYKKITWIDLVSPTQDEVREAAQELGVDAQVASELLSPTLRPHIEKYENHLYLVLHFPTLKPTTHLSSAEQEVDFVIGKDFLITARYEELESFSEFRQVFEVNATLEDDHIGDSPFDIFLLLTRRLYKGVEAEIYTVREKLEYIEKEIFEGYEKEMVVALSHAGRDILNLKQALDPHQEILRSLGELTEAFSGREYVSRVKKIENMYYRSRKHIIRIWQTLSELRETNNSLLSTKQNEVMKKLTIMAFVTFPLMLISSIFGMNTKILPIAGMDNDFWIITGVMLIATCIMFLFFKHKNWL